MADQEREKTSPLPRSNSSARSHLSLRASALSRRPLRLCGEWRQRNQPTCFCNGIRDSPVSKIFETGGKPAERQPESCS